MGLAFSPEMITDPDVNLRIGTGYLKLVLDDFDGSQLMAAAAYNAGPSRPRRWREGALIEPAIWAENIPFNETRDYVKKVLSNATVYAAMLAGRVQVAAAPAAAPVAAPATPTAPARVAAPAIAAVSAASAASTSAAAWAISASSVFGSQAFAAWPPASSPLVAAASDAVPTPALPASSAAVVHALLPSLKARLGALIGPRASTAPAANMELP
jgi:hypothetical protein